MTTAETQAAAARLFETMAAELSKRPLVPIAEPVDSNVTAYQVRNVYTGADIRAALAAALAETVGRPGVLIVWGREDGGIDVNVGGVPQ